MENIEHEGDMETLTDSTSNLSFCGVEGERLVTIESDGTVIVHKEGSDKEAARVFYEYLQTEGKTLHQTIADLKDEIRILRGGIDVST